MLAFSHRFAKAINPRYSLKARLGLAIVGIALILSISIGMSIGYTTRGYMEAHIGKSLAQLAYQMSDKLDRGMFERYRDIQILTSLDQIKNPDAPASAKRELLDKLQSTFPDYAWIGLTDTQGKVLVSTGKVLEDKDVRSRPWFEKGRTGNYVGDVHAALMLAKIIPDSTGEPLRLVDVAAPVRDLQGNFQGVLGAHLNWKWAEEMEKSLRQVVENDDSVEVLILGEDGTVLLGPPELETQQLSLTSAKAVSGSQNPYKVETWSDGKSYLSGFARSIGYRNYPGLGWIVLVRQKSDIAFAPARQLQQQIFVLTMALGLLLAILGWIIADSLAQPMLAIAAAANCIRQGDTTCKIPIVRGKNELAILSRSLSQLVRSLMQKEQEVQASNLRYRSLVFATAQNVWTTNPQGEVVGDLPMWRGITGQTEAEIQGWGWLEALHPDDRDRAAKLWQDAIETKSLYETEYRVRRYDGSYGYFTVRGVPIVSADYSVQEWVGIHNDISDRKRAQQALQESFSILYAVLEGTTDAIFLKDLQGLYVMLNSTTANIIGKPVEEIIGKDDTELFPPNIAERIIEIDRRIITSATSEVFEEMIPMQGELRTFFTAKTVCRNQQGEMIGIVGVSRDNSDRKLAEQQIKQLNQDLERRVKERTAQLEIANKELEAFSYSVYHDLRAPLRSIDGFSLALLERYSEQLDDKGKHYLQRVRNASQRMGELIDDLLLLARVTRSEMHCQTVNLSEIVQAIISDLQHAQPERIVKFIVAPQVTAQGDPRLLKIVFENLLNNAWKFTSKKSDPIIEFGTLSQPDFTTIYFVRDNGAGFDQTYATNLFGAFQRLHTADEFPGTGIGLATVKRIVHRHGGRIWANGAVEQGATFYFTLHD